MRSYYCAYHSLLQDWSELTNEEVGILFRACLVYSSTGEELEIDNRLVRSLFMVQKRLIDEAKDHYQHISDKRKAAISTRWNTNEYKCISSDTKNTNVDNKEERRKKKKLSKESKSEFTPPTEQEVTDYVNEKHFSVDPARFCSYYEMYDWKVKDKPMKDWKAAVRYWETTNKPKSANCSSQYSNVELEKHEVNLLEVQL